MYFISSNKSESMAKINESKETFLLLFETVFDKTFFCAPGQLKPSLSTDFNGIIVFEVNSVNLYATKGEIESCSDPIVLNLP